MDIAELETMVKAFTATLTAVNKVLKTCRSGDKALNGNLGMGSEDGIIRTFQALQGPGKEFFTHAKTVNDLIAKGASTAAPTLPTGGANSRKETAHAVE